MSVGLESIATGAGSRAGLSQSFSGQILTQLAPRVRATP